MLVVDPSGIGLHVGHPLGYIGTDVFGRYQRMTGRHVLHPFGFDTFGLPAEQYAIDTGQHRPSRSGGTRTSCAASCAGWGWRTTTAARS